MYRLLMAALLLSSTARAQPADLPTKADLAILKCQSLFDMKKIDTVMVLAWLQGRYVAKSVLDSEKLYRDAASLNKYCDENPSKTVIDAAEYIFNSKP
jgi:hypothetical protein